MKIRNERDKFEAFLTDLDIKVKSGFSNELENDYEKKKGYKALPNLEIVNVHNSTLNLY